MRFRKNLVLIHREKCLYLKDIGMSAYVTVYVKWIGNRENLTKYEMH